MEYVIPPLVDGVESEIAWQDGAATAGYSDRQHHPAKPSPFGKALHGTHFPEGGYKS